MALLIDINSRPHVRCNCKVTFRIGTENLDVCEYSENPSIIQTECPNCWMIHTWRDPVSFFNEFFSIIDPVNEYRFLTNSEAIRYFKAYEKLIHTLE